MHSHSMFTIYVSISQIKISLVGEKRNGAKIIVLIDATYDQIKEVLIQMLFITLLYHYKDFA